MPELAKAEQPCCLCWLWVSKDCSACGLSLSSCTKALTGEKGDFRAFRKDNFKLMTEKMQKQLFYSNNTRKEGAVGMYLEAENPEEQLSLLHCCKVIFCFHRTDDVRRLFQTNK